MGVTHPPTNPIKYTSLIKIQMYQNDGAAESSLPSGNMKKQQLQGCQGHVSWLTSVSHDAFTMKHDTDYSVCLNVCYSCNNTGRHKPECCTKGRIGGSSQRYWINENNYGWYVLTVYLLFSVWILISFDCLICCWYIEQICWPKMLRTLRKCYQKVCGTVWYYQVKA